MSPESRPQTIFSDLLLSLFIGENPISDCTRIHEHSVKTND